MAFRFQTSVSYDLTGPTAVPTYMVEAVGATGAGKVIATSSSLDEIILLCKALNAACETFSSRASDRRKNTLRCTAEF